MSHLLNRTMLALTLLFALPILLIRAQAHDDSDLRAFLTPTEDCPAPCFMGIRPGLTTAAQAVDILRANAWVSDINVPTDNAAYEYIWWDWSSAQPAFIDSDVWGALLVVDGTITRVTVGLKEPYGDVAQVLAMPDKHILQDNDSNGLCDYMALYKRYFMTVALDNSFRTPITLSSFWRARKLRVWVDRSEADAGYAARFAEFPSFRLGEVYRASGWCRLAALE